MNGGLAARDGAGGDGKQPESGGGRTFVGFGFGAIQAGLFLYEASLSGCFTRFVIAEVVSDTVQKMRAGGGTYRVNIAHLNGIETATIGPVELYDPAVEDHRQALIAAIAEARELATAIPSVSFYRSESPGSIHRLLAAGLAEKVRQGGPRAIIYAAENHNHAAELLQKQVLSQVPADLLKPVQSKVRFLNTVIGKMSGVITEEAEMKEGALLPVCPGDKRAFLVEEFNRILISRIDFGPLSAPFDRGIGVFEEKDDLLPFEEAKLYGHNATHALAAYLAALRGIPTIAELRGYPALVDFLRRAFIEESGETLIRRYRGWDPLFTPKGYERYADDLLERMMNRFLRDRTERVGRDPRRKLAWDDRLIGTIRLALRHNVRPSRYAIGAAAALASISPAVIQAGASIEPLVEELWPADISVQERGEVLNQVDHACVSLRQWLNQGNDLAPPA
jgi:mannitol-1-phosphate 5-dehydrogenase